MTRETQGNAIPYSNTLISLTHSKFCETVPITMMLQQYGKTYVPFSGSVSVQIERRRKKELSYQTSCQKYLMSMIAQKWYA